MRSIALSACAGVVATASAQQVWIGYDHSFEKPDSADWTLPENQDRITDTVWITRQDTQGIFNIYSEDAYAPSFSPEGTEWSFGRAEDWPDLEFQPWQNAVNGNPPGMVGRAMAVHLIDEDIYLDLMFTDWTSRGGGGFAYLRATPAPASVLGLLPLVAMRRRRC